MDSRSDPGEPFPAWASPASDDLSLTGDVAAARAYFQRCTQSCPSTGGGSPPILPAEMQP